MSKKSLFILLFFTALTFNSCDWVRVRLGMPTSQELQIRKEQARQDSIYQAEYLRHEWEQQQRLEDDLFDTTAPAQVETTPASTPAYTPAYTGSAAPMDINRFHVVVGSFRESKNAIGMVKRLAERGYRPTELLFKNGFMVISAGSYAQLPEAITALHRMQSVDASLCPYDAYVYDMVQRRHVESNARW